VGETKNIWVFHEPLHYFGCDPVYATPLYYEYQLYKTDDVPQNNPSNAKYRLLIATWRRMPIRLANWLGPKIVRNLG